ncbi:hypothetical protein FQZ97_731820 [compost metagenome]
MATTGGQARHVLEDDQRHWVVLPCLAHQPDAAQSQFVESLIFRRLAHLLRQQAGGPLAGTGDEHGVRAFALGCAAHVLGGGLTPAGRRFLAVEADVLVAGEQIEQGSRHAGQAREVGQPGRVHVNAAEAFPFGLHVPDDRLGTIEALGTAAQAAAEVEVVEGALDHAAGSLDSLNMSSWT